MAKIDLNTVSSGYLSQAALNANFTAIENEFQNKVLYRDNPSGEPNSMQSNLDMNGYYVLNAGNTSLADADNIAYTFDDSAAEARTISDKLNEIVSVKDFGAAGDGVTDDTVAIQAALNAVKTFGGCLRFPSGKYIVSSGLTLDLTGFSSDADVDGVDIIGDGDSNTSLEWVSATSGTILSINGGVSGAQLHLHLRLIGLKFNGNGVGSGLSLNIGAFSFIERCYFYTCVYGLSCTDVLSSRFIDCRFRFNTYGMQFSGATAITNPNALSFYGCHFGVNSNFGARFDQPSQISFFGGSFEGNGGAASGAVRCGIYINSAGNEGAVGLNCYGVYFENNQTVADIWIKASATYPSMHSIQACNFNRVGTSGYAPYNIQIDQLVTDAELTVCVSDCAFKGFGSYTPSVSRPYIKTFTSGVATVLAYNNYYDSTTEAWTSTSASRAKCVFNGTLASPAPIDSSYGVSSISKAGTGVYTLTFTKNFPTSVYPVSVSVGGSAGIGYVWSTTENTIQVRTSDLAGVATDFGQVHVIAG
jgi:hypothetical protein